MITKGELFTTLIVAMGLGIIAGVWGTVRSYDNSLPRPEAYRLCDEALSRQHSRCDDQLLAMRSNAAMRISRCACPTPTLVADCCPTEAP